MKNDEPKSPPKPTEKAAKCSGGRETEFCFKNQRTILQNTSFVYTWLDQCRNCFESASCTVTEFDALFFSLFLTNAWCWKGLFKIEKEFSMYIKKDNFFFHILCCVFKFKTEAHFKMLSRLLLKLSSFYFKIMLLLIIKRTKVFVFQQSCFKNPKLT